MRIVGMMTVYNESDIVGQVVDHLISQGVQLVIVDNGSTDESHEICTSYLGRGVLAVERLLTEYFEFRTMLRELHKLAVENKADWALLSGADEFLESPYRGLRLGEAIRLEAQKGYNLIQFDNFEFWPTEKDHDILEKDVRKRLRHYSWHDDFQFRCYRVYPGTCIDESAGHIPTFPNGIAIKVSPNKFVLRHYKIRSYDHGLRKVFHERLPRYSPELRKMGWHIHYDNFGTERNYFIIDSSKLTRYEEDGNWNLTKTFDGSFGTWNPPTVVDQLREKDDKIKELEEELRKRDSEIAELNNSVALRLARMIPLGAHIRKLFASRRGHSY